MARILYVCGGRNFKSNNLGAKISGVVNSWKTAGHEVLHFCGGDIGSEENHFQSYGAQSHHNAWYRRLTLLAPFVRTISEWRDICHDAKMFKLLAKTVTDWKPNIIWERSSRLHSAGLRVAKQIGSPYVLEWKDHLIPYNVSFFRLKAGILESRKNHQADYIVVESGVLRDQLENEGVNKEKIIVAHNAAEPSRFTCSSEVRLRVRSELSVGQDEILVGYLGSYAFYHDAERLVLAAAELKRKNQQSIKVLMVGNGENEPQCQTTALNLGLRDNPLIMRPGVPSREVPELLSALDVAVLPGSTGIICPIKVQEYMAAGLPVIVPDYPCNREVITENETGLFFTPFNEEALADAIARLARDSALREKIGRQARVEVDERFTWEKTWGAALEKILYDLNT